MLDLDQRMAAPPMRSMLSQVLDGATGNIFASYGLLHGTASGVHSWGRFLDCSGVGVNPHPLGNRATS
jgi:hypothetical protein